MKSMRLFFFIVLMVLFVVPVNAINIVYSTTNQSLNITEVNAKTAGWTVAREIIPGINGTGTYNISWDYKCVFSAGDCAGFPIETYVRLNGATAVTSTFSDGTETYQTATVTITGSFNDTDTFELMARPTVYDTNLYWYVRNYRMMFDGEPVNLSYTYNQTGINFSWSSNPTGFIGYNFQYTNSYGGWVITAITTNYSFVPAIVGQNISIRIYPYNTTTGTYLSGYAKMSDYYSIGGNGYNWSANYSYAEDNLTWDRNFGGIRYGSYLNSFDQNDCSKITVVGGSTSCADGFLKLNETGAALQFAYVNDYTMPSNNFNILNAYIIESTPSVYSLGNAFWYMDNSNSEFYYDKNSASTDKQNWQRLPGWFSVNTTNNAAIGTGNIYWVESQVYNNQHMGSIWLNSDSRPATWENTNLSSNPQTNSSHDKFGVLNYRANSSVYHVWIRNVSDSGDVVISGNVTMVFDATTFANSTSNSIMSYTGQIASYLSNGRIDIYVSASDNGIDYSSERLLISSSESGKGYSILDSEKKRYLKVKYNVIANSVSDYPILTNALSGIQNINSVSGYVTDSGTGINGATVLTAYNSTTTDENGYYELLDFGIGNISIVAGNDTYYSFGDILLNSTSNSSITNKNFSLISAPIVNPNQLDLLSYDVALVYIPYINVYGHPEDNPYNYNNMNGGEGYLPQVLAYNYNRVNRTPEILEYALRSTNHLVYAVLKPRYYYDNLNHNPDQGGANNADFLIWSLAPAMKELQNNVSSDQWNVWNQSMIDFNTSDYSSLAAAEPDNPYKYLTSNWHMIVAAGEKFRQSMCGTCVNETILGNLIKQLNYSVTDEGYYQGSELSSNYNIVQYTMAVAIYQDGRTDDVALNRSIEYGRNYVRNSQLQDGQVMQFARSAGYTASYSQNIYTMFAETENRSEAYRFADLQYQKIAEHMDDVSYIPLMNFYGNRTDGSSIVSKDVQDMLTAMYLSRSAKIYDNSIVESSRDYGTYISLNDGDVVSDALYNSSGIIVNNPSNYSVYIHGKYVNKTAASGSVVMVGYPVITVKNAMNFTVNPMPEVDQGVAYTFPVMFNQKSILSSLNFNESNVYGDVDTNIIHLNLTNLNFTTKFIQSYNLTTEYNLTADAIDVTINITWDNSTYPLTSFEYGIPFIIDDNRTSAIISGNATAGTIDFIRGNDTVNISNIQLINASELVINTSTGLIGYVPFGKSEITTMEATITQSPVTLKYTHKVSTTNVYGYALNQPPSLIESTPEQYINTTYPTAHEFTITTSQATTANWYINEVLDETDTSSLSNSYTNSSPVVGNHTVRVHYENAQGQENYTWYWNVSLETVPPASVTNPQTATGNFWINNTWTQPVDADLNHTWFMYANETLVENVSAEFEYLNLTYSTHYEQNISAQTCDTTGNCNTTKVWFNATIPNNVPVLTPIGDIEVTEGDTIDFTLSTTDPDGDTMTNTSNASQGTFTAATGNYNWVTIVGDAGTYTNFNFTVDDGYGGTDMEVITITVNPQVLYPNSVTGLTLIGYVNGSALGNWTAVQP